MKKVLMFIMFFSILLPVKIYAEETKSDTVYLNNCVDGNSARFMLGLHEIKVKFIAVESDEIIKDDKTDEINESFISDYVCEMLKSAKKIRIEYEPNAQREDKYGRIQAWVFVDDVLLQEDLVSIGYARVMYLNDNYLYADKLKEAQSNAKKMNLGIWKQDKEEMTPSDAKEEIVEEKKSKGFFETIIDFFKDLFKGLLSFIDDLINNIL